MLTDFRRLPGELRALPRGVWVLVGGQFINRLGAFVSPFLPLFLAGEGLDLAHISAVLAAMGVGQFMAPFAGGYLADALGRRHTIVLALTGGAASMFALYFVPHGPLLVAMAVALVHGCVAYLYGPAANALLSDLVTPAQRPTAFAVLRLAINAGFSAGPAIAGWLFAVSPVWIFAGDAGTTLVYAVLAILFLPHGLRTVAGRVTSPRVFVASWREAGRAMWGSAAFVQVWVSGLLMAVGFFQVFHVLALHAVAQGLSTQAYGIAMAANGVVILVCELPVTWWVRRFAPRRALAAGFALLGLGTASFGWAETLPQFLAAMTLFTVGEMIALPTASAYVAELAPVALRGRTFGLYGMTWGVAGLIGSAGPWIYGQLGANWWVVAGALGVLGGVNMLRGVRERSPDAAEAAQALSAPARS